MAQAPVHPDTGGDGAVLDNTSIRRATLQQQTEASIAGVLATARAEGRSARFRLTVVPAVMGALLFSITSLAYILDLPFALVPFPFATLAVSLSFLPADKKSIKIATRFCSAICCIAGLRALLSGIVALLSLLSDDTCYADQVSVTLDENEEVECVWAWLATARLIPVAVGVNIVAIWLLRKMFDTTISSNHALELFLWGTYHQNILASSLSHLFFFFFFFSSSSLTSHACMVPLTHQPGSAIFKLAVFSRVWRLICYD